LSRCLEVMSPRMRQKGRVKFGADADLSVFDPVRVIDKATYANPAQYSTRRSGLMLTSTEGSEDNPVGQNGKYIAQGKRCSPAFLSSRISVRKRKQACRDAFNHRIYDSVERCAEALAPFFPSTIRSPVFASRFSSRRIGLPRFE